MKIQLKANNLLEKLLWMLYGIAVIGCILADITLLFLNKIMTVGSSFVLLVSIASLVCLAIFIIQFTVYKKAKNTLSVYLTACLLEPLKFACMLFIVVEHIIEFSMIVSIVAYTLILLFIAIIILQVLVLTNYMRTNEETTSTQKQMQAEAKSKRVLEVLLCTFYGLAVLGCIIVDIVIGFNRASSSNMFFMWNMIIGNMLYAAIFIAQFIVYKKVKNIVAYTLIVSLLEPIKWYFMLFVVVGHFVGLLTFILIPLFMTLVPIQIVLFIKGIVERKKKKNIQVQGRIKHV